MYLILRPDMMIEVDHSAVYIYSVVEQAKNLKINIKTEMTDFPLIDLLKNGYPIDGKKLPDQGNRIIPYLWKKYPNFFDCVTETNRRKLINQRGVLSYAHRVVDDRQILQDYIAGFDTIDIYLSEPDDLGQDLQEHGFGVLKPLTEKKPTDRGIVLYDVDKALPGSSLNPGDVLVLYSLRNLTIGPILIHGVTGCLTCFYKAYQEINRSKNVMENHKKIVRMFIVNILLFLSGDLYKAIKLDVGLPLNKYYDIEPPGLRMRARQFLKNNNCERCITCTASN